MWCHFWPRFTPFTHWFGFYYTELFLLCTEHVFTNETGLPQPPKGYCLHCSVRRTRAQGPSLIHTAFTGTVEAFLFSLHTPNQFQLRCWCHYKCYLDRELQNMQELWIPKSHAENCQHVYIHPLLSQAPTLKFRYGKPSRFIDLRETCFQATSFSCSVCVT